ncbi:hypothetical protein [Streptomyces luteogriseus]|uniref:hypothetical protein n=1 Tax=Streptomyces luteogriseus TaxID=68233 RepID=UPI0037A2A851
MKKKYTAAELRELPTLCVGQADDLKIEDNEAGLRVWLGRVQTDLVMIEERDGEGNWHTTEEYPG